MSNRADAERDAMARAQPMYGHSGPRAPIIANREAAARNVGHLPNVNSRLGDVNGWQRGGRHTGSDKFEPVPFETLVALASNATTKCAWKYSFRSRAQRFFDWNDDEGILRDLTRQLKQQPDTDASFPFRHDTGDVTGSSAQAQNNQVIFGPMNGTSGSFVSQIAHFDPRGTPRGYAVPTASTGPRVSSIEEEMGRGSSTLHPPESRFGSEETTQDRSQQRSDTRSSHSSYTSPFRPDQWWYQFEKLRKFHAKHGHSRVPNSHPDSSLVWWVKRQRYQRTLQQTGRSSTLYGDRISALEDIGFVWNAQKSTWDARLEELVAFQLVNGNCNVPITSKPPLQKLAIWVKCQRRQYQLFQENQKKSSMTLERIRKLESIGFEWNVAKHQVKEESSLDD